MIRINMSQLKTHLSRYLANLAEGETILLCKRNVPIAEIRRLPCKRKTARPIGLAKGAFEIPESFFEPLPDDISAPFGG